MAIKLALRIAKEIREGQWEPKGHGNPWKCFRLERNDISLWVANTALSLHIDGPTYVKIPVIDRLIIWYGGRIGKLKRAEVRKNKAHSTYEKLFK